MVKSDRTYLGFYVMSVAVAVLLISIVMQTYRFPAALIFNMVAPLMCLLTTILIGWIYQDKERSRQKIVRMGQHLFLETLYALGSVEEDDEQFTEELGEDASADDGEQPAEEDQEEIEIVLPWQMIWRANRVGYFIATGMQLFGAGLVLLAMTASHFFNTDPAEMDQGWQFVMLFVFILLSFAAICAVAMAFLLYRRIDVSESDITTRHWGRTYTIRWEEVQLFWHSTGPNYFELASTDSIIRWSIWPPSMDIRYASASDEEIWAFHALITERTGLPLVDGKKFSP